MVSFGCYYFLNNLMPKAILVLPMAGFAWAMHRVMPEAIQLRVAGLPLGVRLTAALIVGEFGSY